MYLFCGFFIVLLACAQGDEEGHCVMRGNCAMDEKSLLLRPCVYNGTALPLNDTSSIELLNEYCPTLQRVNNSVCCDSGQMDILGENLNSLAVLFKRCPSCFHNLANVFCHLACSPNQSLFLKVMNFTTSEEGQSINEMNYYITESYATGLYDSCKNVQQAFTGNPAIKISCGNQGECSPHQWLNYMGGNPPSPYKINFHFETSDVIFNGTTFFPMNETIIPCHQPVTPDGASCSCVDCPCDPTPPPEPSKDHRKLFGLPLVEAIALIIYIMLAIGIIGGFVFSKYFKKSNADEELLILGDEKLEKKANFIEKWGTSLDEWLKGIFTKWGVFCASHPVPVILTCLAFCIIFCCGLLFFTVTSDPVELWSSPSSQAREEKKYFDEHFGPFYRTEQIIITRKNKDPVVGGNLTFSSVFDRHFLHQVLDLQSTLSHIIVENNNESISLQDICFAPVEERRCMIQSPLNWFQNSAKNLDLYDNDTYLQYLENCTLNPFFLQNEGLSCLGDYGGPIFPYVALGGVPDKNYNNATAVIITFMVKNHLNSEDNSDAEAWEKKFIEILKNYSNSDMEFAFSAQRSIEDELNRESHSDEVTILISYLVMFIYVSVTLGQYHSLGTLFIQSKIILGLSGVLIVLLSVVSSLGILSYTGVPATLIIIEVIPFLVLAVGVDNIFIMVQAYQRSHRSAIETRQQHIGRVVGQVIPSILLASFAESSCFFLGALSTMPAVHAFALYSGLALLIDFLLQISCFVSILSLDAAREESGRLDICCCVKKADHEPPSHKRGFLYNLFEKYYAPFLMKDYIRCPVLLVFSGWLCLSIGVIGNINVGLDQKLSMPKDSYVLDYFNYLENYLSVGPPVYFVVKSGYNYSSFDEQNAMCSVVYCSHESLVTQISDASIFSNRTYIAHPPMSWLDNYISWANSQNPKTGCCRVYANDSTLFCPPNIKFPFCTGCRITDKNTFRPTPDKFNSFLLDFLEENPTANCAVAGHAAFVDAIELVENDTQIGATHFMTYHTILKTSDDYTEALKWARNIADNITYTLYLSNATSSEVEVFPYSIFYVFYEQYLTVSKDTIISILISIVDIFLVTLLLMGLDFYSAIIMVLTISMILLDLMGLMYFWDISLNAVSLVNLVMSVGISVEFCSHIIRSFAFNREGSKIDRARIAVAHMGSSVLSGITLTKFGGIVVLAFSKSQIFQIFYFRMYLGIVLIGAAHGLIFLPVFLSVIGPPRKIKFAQKSRGNPLKGSMEEEHYNSDISLAS